MTFARFRTFEQNSSWFDGFACHLARLLLQALSGAARGNKHPGVDGQWEMSCFILEKATVFSSPCEGGVKCCRSMMVFGTFIFDEVKAQQHSMLRRASPILWLAL